MWWNAKHVVLFGFAGESGLGKSTLINSMFLTDIYNNDYPGPSLRGKKTVEVGIAVLSQPQITEHYLYCLPCYVMFSWHLVIMAYSRHCLDVLSVSRPITAASSLTPAQKTALGWDSAIVRHAPSCLNGRVVKCFELFAESDCSKKSSNHLTIFNKIKMEHRRQTDNIQTDRHNWKIF